MNTYVRTYMHVYTYVRTFADKYFGPFNKLPQMSVD